MAKKVCKDHRGNVYASVKDMCAFYGVSTLLYWERTKKGFSIEEALTLPKQHPVAKKCKDHCNNEFESIKEMCDYWGINYGTFRGRRRKGWSIKKSLTTPIYSTECKDHLGNNYKSISEMCVKYEVSPAVYYARLSTGKGIEYALKGTYKEKNKINYKGVEYLNLRSLCESLGFPKKSYKSINYRINHGWTLERALSSEIRCNTVTYKGVEYSNRTELCNKLGISRGSLNNMLKISGNDIEKAVDLVFERRRDSNYVYKGLVYKSLSEVWRASDQQVSYREFQRRIKQGECSIEEALDKNYHKKYKSITIDNITYHSVRDACIKLDISEHFFKKYLNDGISYEDAVQKCKTDYENKGLWYEGKHYSSLRDLCNKKHRPYKIVYARINNSGLSIHDALDPDIDITGKKKITYNGKIYTSLMSCCKENNLSYDLVHGRLQKGFTPEEALTLPKNMYLGEYRVAEVLKRLDVKFYHDCTIKRVFEDLQVPVDWTEFLTELQNIYKAVGFDWTKKSIERLRPDFVLYTDENNRIRGVIEFDGAQHQKLVDKFFKTVEDFFRRSDTDFVKQSLWEYLEIPMLRIRDDQIDIIDEMVENFIAFPEDYIENHNTYLDNEEYWAGLEEEKDHLRKLEPKLTTELTMHQ